MSYKQIQALLIEGTKDSNMTDHVNREWQYAFEPGKDKMQDLMGECVRDMVMLFAMQGHSGFSASCAIACIEKALRQEPLSPLSGVDGEWTEYADGLFQNKRLSRVFKDGKDGQAYELDGYAWRDKDGHCYTDGNSRRKVNFPYMPIDTVIYDEALNPKQNNGVHPDPENVYVAGAN